jgi:hypothetical protein
MDAIVQDISLVVECIQTCLIDFDGVNYVIGRFETFEFSIRLHPSSEHRQEIFMTDVFLDVRFFNSLGSKFRFFYVQRIHFRFQTDEFPWYVRSGFAFKFT